MERIKALEEAIGELVEALKIVLNAYGPLMDHEDYANARAVLEKWGK